MPHQLLWLLSAACYLTRTLKLDMFSLSPYILYYILSHLEDPNVEPKRDDPIWIGDDRCVLDEMVLQHVIHCHPNCCLRSPSLLYSRGPGHCACFACFACCAPVARVPARQEPSSRHSRTTTPRGQLAPHGPSACAARNAGAPSAPEAGG